MSPEKKKPSTTTHSPLPSLRLPSVAHGRHHRSSISSSSSSIIAKSFCLALGSALAFGAWAWLSLVFLPGCPYCWRLLHDWSRLGPPSPLALPWQPPPGHSIANLHKIESSALPPRHSYPSATKVSGTHASRTHGNGFRGTEVSGSPVQVSGNPGGFSGAEVRGTQSVVNATDVSGTHHGSASSTEVSGTPCEVSRNPGGFINAKVSRTHGTVRGPKVTGTHTGVSGTKVSGTHHSGVSSTKISRNPDEFTRNPGGCSGTKVSRRPGGLSGTNDNGITPSGAPSTTIVSQNPGEASGYPGFFSGAKASGNPGSFSSAGGSKSPSCDIGTKVSRNSGSFSGMEDSPQTLTLHHLVFCVAGSAKLWPKRKEYVKLWWKAHGMRGYVWLDENYQNNPGEALPQIMVSEDTSRFRYTNVFGLPSSIRIARIIHETFKLGLPDVHWFIMGDDDTIFAPENLMHTLAKYDSSGMYYVGQSSESHLSNVAFSDSMAFGGAGIAISYPLAEELSEMIDQCLERYPFLFSSDDRLQACITELGVPLIKEPGFHQFDVRGSVFGLLAAHPIAPFLSMHHLDLVDPLFPHLSRLDSLKLFTRAMNTEPSGFLQRAICYDRNQRISYSISVGYVIQVYPYIISPRDLDKPEITFQAWNGKDGEAEFALDTRKAHAQICNRPLLFFLEEMHASQTDPSVFSSYSRNVTLDNEKRRPFCLSHIYLMDQLQRIRVTSKPMVDRWFLTLAMKGIEEKVQLYKLKYPDVGKVQHALLLIVRRAGDRFGLGYEACNEM